MTGVQSTLVASMLPRLALLSCSDGMLLHATHKDASTHCCMPQILQSHCCLVLCLVLSSFCYKSGWVSQLDSVQYACPTSHVVHVLVKAPTLGYEL